MFGFFDATPYFDGKIIDDSKSDYRAAEKLGDVRLSKKAVYFQHDGTLYYLPYEAIEEVVPMELNEHHSCCSGDSTMKVYKLLIKADGKNVYIEFPNAEDVEIFGHYIFFIVCFHQDIAFLGTARVKKKKGEVIISDWFGPNTEYDVMSRILDVDFTLFSDRNMNDLYDDYLWAISRPYIRIRESKMFLIYGCGQPVFSNANIVDPYFDNIIPITIIDTEATLEKNSAYYLDMYGDDYFIDKFALEKDDIEILDEESDEPDELEWAKLEMELEIENEEEEEEEDDREYYPNEDNEQDVVEGMNPEEMLKYIQEN